MEPLMRAVDLHVGEAATVELADGSAVAVKLLALDEVRDPICHAVRHAEVVVDVAGHTAALRAAMYELPMTVGDVQIDCSITSGCVQHDDPAKGAKAFNPWELDADARLRLWPADSPWVRPGSLLYPVEQRWLATDTQMANDPVFVDGFEDPNRCPIYYHNELDFGGADGLVPVVSATDGQVVLVGEDVFEPGSHPYDMRPRYDVVAVRDARGWYVRYAHLDSIHPSVKLGERIEQGGPIGILGKEGSSGGWAHLHFGIKGLRPSGRVGTIESYAFAWQAYCEQHNPQILAVARPHHIAAVGEEIALDATRSWAQAGIASFEWTFTDGSAATGPTPTRAYDRPGRYSETVKVADAEGHVDYDFAVVCVLDPARTAPDQSPPSIHPAFHPSLGNRAGDDIVFAVRSFRIDARERAEGCEVWDFGDGSPTVSVQSDGNAVKHAKDGYAFTAHRYDAPGDYIATVQRTTHRGETATGRLHVRVGPR